MTTVSWGGVAWLSTVAAAFAGLGELTLVDALLLLAVLVVAPAAVPLHPAASGTHASVVLLAALPAAPALLLERGLLAAVLVLPWLATAVAGAVVAATWWLANRRGLVDAVWVAAAAYLVVGAGWLGADRLDLEPAGFAAPFVQLTAIHFHYAGFAASMLAGCAWRWRPGRLPAAAVLLIAAAPPVVAIGFTTYGPLQVAGAGLLTAGLWLLAWETIRRIAPATPPPARWLLVISALATLAPMVLAVQWAIGHNYGTPALSIPAMVRFHGVLNAVGFTLLGVLGWRQQPHTSHHGATVRSGVQGAPPEHRHVPGTT